jgi:hypothetical protein
VSQFQEQIKQELTQIQELVAQAERLLNLANKTEDPDYLTGLVSGLALHLHGFYTSAHNLIEDSDSLADEPYCQCSVSVPDAVNSVRVPQRFCSHFL